MTPGGELDIEMKSLMRLQSRPLVDDDERENEDDDDWKTPAVVATTATTTYKTEMTSSVEPPVVRRAMVCKDVTFLITTVLLFSATDGSVYAEI